jgi:opacity protein-like surface antigen
MKKIMMIAAMMLLSVGAFAQGKFAVGANAGIALYGDDYNPFGVGAKLQYGFDGGFRTELAYNYWFAKEEAGVKAGVMDIDLNLHYLIPVSEGLNVYPIVGANLAFTHGDGDSESIFGFQGGFGIEYYLSDNVKLNLDAKYQYNKKTVDIDIMGYKTSIDMKFDGPVIQAGIAYVF